MNNRALWNLMQEARAAIGPHYGPVLDGFVSETGLDAATWGLLLAGLSFEPETLSPARLQMRIPYTAAEAYLTRSTLAVEKGYLVEVSLGEYRLTDAGRTEMRRSIELAREAIAEADPLPRADAERLVSLVRRLVEFSLAAPPPPDTWCIRHSFRLMPMADPALPYVEQAISCLGAYRDDAHLAAWRSSGLSATTLETLTLLWRGGADSLTAVFERLTHRGHPLQVYAQALGELRERGFVEGPDGAPRVTVTGQSFRDEVEATTDRCFYGPWACLKDAERGELGELMTRLRDGLRESAP